MAGVADVEGAAVHVVGTAPALREGTALRVGTGLRAVRALREVTGPAVMLPAGMVAVGSAEAAVGGADCSAARAA